MANTHTHTSCRTEITFSLYPLCVCVCVCVCVCLSLFLSHSRSLFSSMSLSLSLSLSPHVSLSLCLSLLKSRVSLQSRGGHRRALCPPGPVHLLGLNAEEEDVPVDHVLCFFLVFPPLDRGNLAINGLRFVGSGKNWSA